MNKLFSFILMGSVTLFFANCTLNTPTAGPGCTYPAGSTLTSQLQSKTLAACSDYSSAVMTTAEEATVQSNCTAAGGTWSGTTGCNSSDPHSCSAIPASSVPGTGTGTFTTYFNDSSPFNGLISYTAGQVACTSVMQGTWK